MSKQTMQYDSIVYVICIYVDNEAMSNLVINPYRLLYQDLFVLLSFFDYRNVCPSSIYDF